MNVSRAQPQDTVLTAQSELAAAAAGVPHLEQGRAAIAEADRHLADAAVSP
jgi:hypothetical protein